MGIVCLCIDLYHLTLLASVALSVSVGVGVYMYLSLVGHAGLRDLSGHDWTGGVGHVGLNDLSGHDSGCVGLFKLHAR